VIVTPEAAALAETWAPAIPDILNRMALARGAHLWDELESEAQVALCELAEAHDPSRGSFSTFLYYALPLRLFDWARSQHVSPKARTRRNRAEVRSLFEHVGDPDEGLERIDVLALVEELPDDVEWDRIAAAFAALTDRERDCVRATLHPGAWSVVSARWGISEARISQVRQGAIRQMRLHLELPMQVA
jgi:RNA polymerase sigma factor (sigma-70 family)